MFCSLKNICPRIVQSLSFEKSVNIASKIIRIETFELSSDMNGAIIFFSTPAFQYHGNYGMCFTLLHTRLAFSEIISAIAL